MIISNKYRAGAMGAGHASTLEGLESGSIIYERSLSDAGADFDDDLKDITAYSLKLVKFPNNLVVGRLVLEAVKDGSDDTFLLRNVPSEFLPDSGGTIFLLYGIDLNYVTASAFVIQVTDSNWMISNFTNTVFNNNTDIIIGNPTVSPVVDASFQYALI